MEQASFFGVTGAKEGPGRLRQEQERQRLRPRARGSLVHCSGYTLAATAGWALERPALIALTQCYVHLLCYLVRARAAMVVRELT